MLKFMFCPNISLYSFTSLITIVDICFFVVCFAGSLAEYGTLSTGAFLGPDQRLFKNFDKNPSKISQG
jgi:hypothetical protein